MKIPTQIYQRLTPEERFHTFIEAAARRDEEELERLNARCPMKNYQVEDPAYFLPKTSAILLDRKPRIRLTSIRSFSLWRPNQQEKSLKKTEFLSNGLGSPLIGGLEEH